MKLRFHPEEVLDDELHIKAVADLRRKPYFWSTR
jgi:hypothetical protein